MEKVKMEKLKSNKKIAFSLAESLISMMLLVFAIMLTMTSITKKKFQTKSKMKTGGMYACWYDNDKLHYSYYEGNKKRENNDNAEECIFKMDRRVDNYYVIAVGSRKCDSSNNCVDGQVAKYVTRKSDSENHLMEIELGDFDGELEQNETTVKYKNQTVALVRALGNTSITKSKLAEGNIEKCEFIDNSPCEIISKTECIVNDYGKSGVLTIKCKNRDNSQTEYSLALRPNPTKNIGEAQGEAQVLKEDNNNEKIYIGDCIENTADADGTIYNDVKVKIQERDLMFKASENNDTKKSPFVHYLKTFPVNRQNGLTDELLKYYQKDNDSKKGVVLIFW